VKLVVSIGNSHVAAGVHADGGWVRRWRVQTVPARTHDEYLVIFRALFAEAGIPTGACDTAIFASVVPSLTGTIAEVARVLAGCEPLALSLSLDLGIRVITEVPSEVGADLVANAVAAWDRWRAAAVVVDFGTALSFTAVAPPGELRGVAIAPGLTPAVESLVRATAQLPSVFLAPPPAAIGRTTTHSIQAGIVFGYAGLVGEIIRRMRAELGGSAGVIVTGGQGAVLAPFLGDAVVVEPWLTLEGLRIVAERSARGS
jgi:type III pantothenate kinase